MRFIFAAVLACVAAASSVTSKLDDRTAAALAPYLTGDEATDLELVELAVKTQEHAVAYASAHAELQGKASKAAAEGKWRFGGQYTSQNYGMWKMHQGSWVFGNDRRVECEACNYVLYMLIDRLGDQFSRVTIEQEAELLCPRVQWVFRSACDFIVRKNKEVIADMIMKLLEPLDMCKQLTLCPPTPADLAGVGSMQGFGAERVNSFVPPQYRAGHLAPVGVVAAAEQLNQLGAMPGAVGGPAASMEALKEQMKQVAGFVNDAKQFAAEVNAVGAAPAAAAAAPAAAAPAADAAAAPAGL